MKHKPGSGTTAAAPSFQVGQIFNPDPKECGFYAPDAISALPYIPDGQKRLYERLVRWAGKNGYCWYSYEKIAGYLGKPVRTVKADMKVLVDVKDGLGLVRIEHTYQRLQGGKGGRGTNRYRFVWREIIAEGLVQLAALKDDGGKVQHAAHKSKTCAGEITPPNSPANGEKNCQAIEDLSAESSRLKCRIEQGKVQPTALLLLSSSNSFNRNSHSSSRTREKNSDSLNSNSFDDDCQTYRTPQDELIAHVKRTAGKDLSLKVIHKINERLELQGCSFQDFVSEVKANHDLGVARNVAGLLTDLAKKLRTVLARPEAKIEAPTPRADALRCTHCGEPEGFGTKLEGLLLVPCPVCATENHKQYLMQQNLAELPRRIRACKTCNGTGCVDDRSPYTPCPDCFKERAWLSEHGRESVALH